MIRKPALLSLQILVTFAMLTGALGGSVRSNVSKHLYVTVPGSASSPHGKIAVFPLGATGDVSPEYQLAGRHTKLVVPIEVAFNTKGDAIVYDAGYVSYSLGSECAAIIEFSPHARGDAIPLRVIKGSRTKICSSLSAYNIAVDRSGNIYIPGDGNVVYVFTPNQDGNVAPARTLTYVQQPSVLAFDDKGDLWNSRIANPEVLDEYSSAGQQLAEINNPGQVYYFAIANGLLYAPSFRPNVVVITDLQTLTTKYSFPYPNHIDTSAAADADGNMYVFYEPPRHQNQPGEILTYPPGATEPSGSLSGSRTGLGRWGIARIGP